MSQEMLDHLILLPSDLFFTLRYYALLWLSALMLLFLLRARVCRPFRDRHPVRLALLLLAFGLLAVRYLVATPFGHNPDEIAHRLYVTALASGHLPVLKPGITYEAHQPPLFYFLAAPFAHLLPNGMLQLIAFRAVSILLGLLVVGIAYGTVRRLFPDRGALAVAVAGFIALLPMHLAVAASISNDEIAILVASLLLFAMTRLALAAPDLDRHAILRHGSLLGLCLGLGMLAKSTLLVLFPTIAAGLAWMARERLLPARTALKIGAAAFLLGLLIALPWGIRNQALYGDPLAIAAFNRAFRAFADQVPQTIQRYGSPAAYARVSAFWTYASFWGCFDNMRAWFGPVPIDTLGPTYSLLAILCLLAVLGLLRTGASAFTPAQRVVLGTAGTLFALTLLSHILFLRRYFQPQGRYLFPALLPIALFFCLGWERLLRSPRLYRAALICGALGLLWLNVIAISEVIPRSLATWQTLPTRQTLAHDPAKP